MKHFFLSAFSALAFIVGAFLLMASSSGVAHQQNTDRTGAPGSDNTCQQCHNQGDFSPEVNAFLVVDGDVEVEQYLPGETYTLVVEVSSAGNPAGYGVHGTVVFEDGSNAGELIDQDDNDCIWLDEVDGRHIFEQNALCSSGFFEVEWVAPPAGNGPVFVYVSCIAANGNSAASGDVYVGGEFDFGEDMTTSVVGQKGDGFKVSSLGQGQVELQSNEPVRCAILSLDGRILFDGPLESGRHTLRLDHQGWAAVRFLTASGTVWTDRIWMNG